MARQKKRINNTPYPEYALETVARCVFPDIVAFFQSEEGQREFEEWKAERDDPEGNQKSERYNNLQ